MLGNNKALRCSIKVVLPLPVCPITPINSPCLISTFTWFIALSS
ncbi:Hypothetical protein BC94_0537 [Mycoplasmopsis bovis]|uniref:Uncharacterized protein n=1 Tax=Mycoplasmopsis bovis TaxID=28903 RepID=A0A8D4D3K0_MYCBV|nr:Hypothetical protein BC85_0534 [Mycoplasmopsis bovis]AMW25803.1 Hypothetical protein BC94_0537 [Mycoplasmopsis bovis]AMW26434.1 Hypothetical protein BC93_0534 [Mycoplasmopsis bovis]